MKLYFSPTSPYARKCLVAAHELGVADRIQIVSVSTAPTQHHAELMRQNPLCKLPTLITDEGVAIYDSRVVCEFLNDLAGGSLFSSGPGKWAVLVDHALADGILDAGLLMRYEDVLRPAEYRWPAWRQTQAEKILSALAQFERGAEGLAGRVDIGSIALASAISYIDFRFGELAWRASCPGLDAWFAGFEQRPSMQATALKG